MSNRTDIVVETDNAEGQVLLSASRVYDLTEDKTQDTINGEINSAVVQLDDDITALDGRLDTAEDDIDDLESEAATIEQSTAIIINGNTSASNVAPGQYVYLKNSTISGLTDKLYTYTGSTTKTAGNTFTSSELSAVPAGGLNDLYDKGLRLTTYKAYPVDTTFHIYTTNLNTYDHVAICGFTPADSNTHVRIANLDNNGVYTYQLVDSVTGNIVTSNYNYLVCILWCKRPPTT